MDSISENKPSDEKTWEKIVMKYAHPDLGKSIWQITNSLLPYILLWFLMYISISYSYLLTILLCFLASGFLIRIFIIFHDCGHNSFFKSVKANHTIGIIMGIITFTPFYSWHHQHWAHHKTSGNLDKRGIGDVWTMTVEEYKESSPFSRFVYRSFRNPFIMFTIGPVFMVCIKNRLSRKTMTREERLNIYFTNIVILLFAVLVSTFIGLKAYLMIQIPVLIISHCIGLWLFYIQHQFDDVSWERGGDWDYKNAAFTGSSFLKLPAVLQWFTGNIGFHHVHHLSSRIPNYNLEACHYENKLFNSIKPLKLLSTFKALYLSLWDEAERHLISFRRIKTISRQI
jgi:acyl-lipid omega-6 desaturase (Delta-12 desaturase)